MDNIANNPDSAPPSDEKLIAGLEGLLERQLKLMRTSRDKAASDLADQTTDVANIIGQKEILKNDSFAVQRQNIERLYKELTLAAAERKLFVTSELNKIRRGKKSVGAYKQETLPTHSNLL